MFSDLPGIQKHVSLQLSQSHEAMSLQASRLPSGRSQHLTQDRQNSFETKLWFLKKWPGISRQKRSPTFVIVQRASGENFPLERPLCPRSAKPSTQNRLALSTYHPCKTTHSPAALCETWEMMVALVIWKKQSMTWFRRAFLQNFCAFNSASPQQRS